MGRSRAKSVATRERVATRSSSNSCARTCSVTSCATAHKVSLPSRRMVLALTSTSSSDPSLRRYFLTPTNEFGLTDHLKLRVEAQEHAQPLAHHAMVVGYQDPYRHSPFSDLGPRLSLRQSSYTIPTPPSWTLVLLPAPMEILLANHSYDRCQNPYSRLYLQ